MDQLKSIVFTTILRGRYL